MDPSTSSPPTSRPIPSGEEHDRPPDVTGTVGWGDEYVAKPHLTEPSDTYFLGMPLGGERIVVRDAYGQLLSVAGLLEGQRIAVWVRAGCAESFPVQCDVVEVAVLNG